MPSGTGLIEYSKKFPKRFFDVGICEEHAVSMCAGMAQSGLTPVFAVYSSFLQRGFDQIITDVCAMNLHVVFCIDRAGIVGEDGETHQGLFDMSYLNLIPNMTVLSPADFCELRLMLQYAVNKHNGPVAIRYPRGGETFKLESPPSIEYKKASLLKSGDDITIVAEGRMVGVALKVSKLLLDFGVKADVINIRFVKPIDTELIKTSVLKTKKLVVIEEGIQNGGLGDRINALLNDVEYKFLSKAIKDQFVEHGSYNELLKHLKLDSESIYSEIKEVFGF